ncbi:MAG: hypothetical protein B7Z80_00820 [Rhodospirillales bacterium 20-64-7]|nr:MAG: hypothetical protein B7Z80_00820 [Rhodospirillales bacterium 20-64-7]HQT75747.1 hypothetical protein [Rhodopila sp.]
MHFDWTTLALQTVNLIVLVWLLRRFLFRPVTALIAERRGAAERLLADAAAVRAAAAADAEQVAAREKALSARGEEILAEARAAARTERAALLQQAQDEIAKADAAAQAARDQDQAQMRRQLEGEARRLAVAIASRLLARIPAQASSAALLQALDTWLAALPAAELRNLASPGETLAVVTAAALDPAAQALCADMLRRRLGDGLSVRFATDPSLIAGAELRGSHARLRNNWRADLDHIAEELSRDDHPLAVA